MECYAYQFIAMTIIEKIEINREHESKIRSWVHKILRIGNGIEPTENDDLVKIHPSILLHHNNDSTSILKLINYVFPNLEKHRDRQNYPLNSAILTTKNSFVDEINAVMIEKYPVEAIEYVSFDKTLTQMSSLNIKIF